MSAQSHVLVTGVSGFLGSHVVDQLVNGGSRVRGIVRSPKISKTQKAYDTAYGSGKVEIVGIDDLVEGDFSSALEGITAVIHLASPLTGRADPETTFDTAIGGTMNVIRQAEKAGVKHFAFASSLASLTGCLVDWNPYTKEEALDGTRAPFYVYSASKVLAEKAIWAFAEEHPDITFTTLNPPFFMGPYAPGFIITPGDSNALSTNVVIYNILVPQSKAATPHVGYVDVREVAAGLVAGIKTPGRNRVLLTGEWFDYNDAVHYIATVRPELKDRLANPAPTVQTQGVIDDTRAQQILGLPPARSWKESLLEVVDTLVQVEKDWTNQGVDIEKTLKKNERIIY